MDEGYHAWRCLMSPLKVASDPSVLHWSKRLEYVRKDIDCTFDVLKRWIRLLRLPLEFRSSKILKVCCMLHNMLLEFDELIDIGQEECD
eukprot:1234415-Pleurochrysis_carterae.AAC.5